MKTLKSNIYILTAILLLTFQLSFSQEKDDESVFNHVLYFKWNETATESKINEVFELFKNLPSKVDDFKSIEINDIVASDGDCDVVIIMEFTSKDILKVYEEHPDHVKISKIAPPLIEGFRFSDYYRKK